MKKIILTVSMFLLFAAAHTVAAQSSKAITPAENSLVRKAIFAVVKKKFPSAKTETIFKVQGNWARVIYNDTDVNVILKKTGKIWKIVWDYNAVGEEGIDASDYLKGVPQGILRPFPEGMQQ